MKKKSAEDYLDRLLNSVNDQKERREKFKETAKMLEDAMTFWEVDGMDPDMQDAEYQQMVAQEEKRSGQEDFLDALLSGAKDTEFGMNKRKPDTNPMYSRRVSKSEAEFLREFEAELASEDEDLADLFEEFEQAVEPEDKLEDEDIQAGQNSEENDDGFALGDVDLAALVEEAAGVMSSGQGDLADEEPADEVSADEVPADEVPLDDLSMLDMLMDDAQTGEQTPFEASAEPIPMDEIPEDVFADLFGDGDSIDLSQDAPAEIPSEGLDLGNLGEEDLMSLLAGADDLSDIGDMLSQSEKTEISPEELEAFSIFEENEMAAQQISAEPAPEEIVLDKKPKKGNFLEKIKGILGGLMKGDEDEEVELKPGKGPTAETLSTENSEILAELDELEGKAGKKEKKKKEKKPKKEKAPKKPKAPKKQKAPKPKKEKKPKEVDNTPPLPKGPVFMIWLMVGSLVAVVFLILNIMKYNTPMANAKSLFNEEHYAEAFSEIKTLKVKEKDLELYNQLAVLSTVDSELNAYEAFAKAGMEDKALDSLICAAGRCHINEADADVYGCLGMLETLRRTASNELEQKYSMTYEEAIEMYTIRHRDDYTYALYKKLTELGIEWD